MRTTEKKSKQGCIFLGETPMYLLNRAWGTALLWGKQNKTQPTNRKTKTKKTPQTNKTQRKWTTYTNKTTTTKTWPWATCLWAGWRGSEQWVGLDHLPSPCGWHSIVKKKLFWQKKIELTSLLLSYLPVRWVASILYFSCLKLALPVNAMTMNLCDMPFDLLWQ